MNNLIHQPRFAFTRETFFLNPEPDRLPAPDFACEPAGAGHDFLVLNLRPDLIEAAPPDDSPYGIDLP